MMSLKVESPQNNRIKLTGAAILVSRGMKVLQAAPAAYPYRYAANAMDHLEPLPRPTHSSFTIFRTGLDIPHAGRNEAGSNVWKLWVINDARRSRWSVGILTRQPSMAAQNSGNVA